MRVRIPHFLALAALFISFTGISKVNAQACSEYFPVQEGLQYDMVSYNAKGKETSRSVNTITNVNADATKTTAVLKQEMKDKKGSTTTTVQSKIICNNGNVELEMKNFLAANEQLWNYEGMDIAVEAENLDFPKTFSVGQKLKNGKITAIVTNMGIKLFRCVTVISERKVEAMEKLTTPAGTFDCAKISFISRSQLGPKLVEVKTLQWYAKGIGLVRSENYNLKKNVLTDYQQVEKIKK